MNDSARVQSVLFKGLAAKPLTVRFEDERTSSDGGAILLKAADERMGMLSSMAAAFTDRREGSRVKHEVEELLAQRIFGIACGYEDGNDAARISGDPVMKTLSGRDPFGEDLASQPSISRSERSATHTDLPWREHEPEGCGAGPAARAGGMEEKNHHRPRSNPDSDLRRAAVDFLQRVLPHLLLYPSRRRHILRGRAGPGFSKTSADHCDVRLGRSVSRGSFENPW